MHMAGVQSAECPVAFSASGGLAQLALHWMPMPCHGRQVQVRSAWGSLLGRGLGPGLWDHESHRAAFATSDQKKPARQVHYSAEIWDLVTDHESHSFRLTALACDEHCHKAVPEPAQDQQPWALDLLSGLAPGCVQAEVTWACHYATLTRTGQQIARGADQRAVNLNFQVQVGGLHRLGAPGPQRPAGARSRVQA